MRTLLLFLACGFPVLSDAAVDYVKLGASAPDREWISTDLEAMARVLADKTVPLPKLSDPATAEYFERMVDRGNLGMAQNATLPIQMRLSETLRFQGAVQNLLMRYAEETSRRTDINHEVTALISCTLLTVREAVVLLDEFLPTIPKDDTYEARMKGLQTMKQGIVTVFAGAETSLSETKFYDASDLSAILKVMAECLPVLSRAFSDAAKQEFSRKLQARMKQFTSPGDRDALLAMLGVLKEKPNKAPEPTPGSVTPRAIDPKQK